MASDLVSSGCNYLTPAEYKTRLQKYIESREIQQLSRIVYGANNGGGVAFTVSFPGLVDFDSVVAYAISNFPKQLLPVFEEALQISQAVLLKQQPTGSVDLDFSVTSKNKMVQGNVKTHCPVRIVSLPPMLTKNSKSLFC